MSDQPERRAGDPAVARLTSTAERLGHQVDALTQAHGRSRRFARWLAASVAFDILLSVGLGYNAIRVDDAIDRAEQASSATRVQCEASNASIRNERDIWNHFILTSANEERTPAEEASRRESIDFLDSKLVEEECP